MVEIISPDWQYEDTDEYNFNRILNVKEQRKLGISRGRTSVPQAPTIYVRVKADHVGLTDTCAIRADLWCYGPAFWENNKLKKKNPLKSEEGHKLTKLRGNTYISCKYNIETFAEPEPDGYRYAELKIFITRGARVSCRKNHIAFRLCVVESASDDGKDKEIKSIPVLRTSRVSISEKAMCPREGHKKARTLQKQNASNIGATYSLKRKAPGSGLNPSFPTLSMPNNFSDSEPRTKRQNVESIVPVSYIKSLQTPSITAPVKLLPGEIATLEALKYNPVKPVTNLSKMYSLPNQTMPTQFLTPLSFPNVPIDVITTQNNYIMSQLAGYSALPKKDLDQNRLLAMMHEAVASNQISSAVQKPSTSDLLLSAMFANLPPTSDLAYRQ